MSGSEGGGGDFAGAAHLAARDEGLELAPGGLVEELFLLGGGDLAGGQDVDADAAVLELVEPDAGPGLLDGLAAGVDAPPGEAAEEALEPVMRMEPPSLKSGRAFWTVNRVPRALSPNQVSNWASVISPSGAGSPPPALAHSTSRLPFSRLTVS